MLHGQLDLLNIRLKDPVQNLRLGHMPVGNLHPLNGIEPVPHQLLQRPVKLRKSLIPQLGGKPHRGGLADPHLFPQPGRGEKHRLVIIFFNIIGQPLLTLTERMIVFPDPSQKIICLFHVHPFSCPGPPGSPLFSFPIIA